LSSRFTQLKELGEGVVSKRFDLSLDNGHYSKPIFDGKGNTYLGMCNLDFGGNQSILIKLDAEGKVVQKFSLNLAAYQKTIFEVAAVKSVNGKVILAGGCKPLSFRYSDKLKFFVAEFDEATGQLSKYQIFNELDNRANDHVIDFKVSDNQIVVLCGATQIGNVTELVSSNEFELYFFDINLNLIKRQAYAPSADDCLPGNLVPTQDGGFLISGYTISGNVSIFKGFFVKVDAEGNLLSNHRLNYQKQLELY